MNNKYKIILRMTTIVPTEERLYRKQLLDYRKNSRNKLMTSRFNNNTWEENTKFRDRQLNIGCIYCSPCPVTKIIPNESVMFILEMNNETNRIMGIGMVRNRPYVGKLNIYTNGNYNRYVYIGKSRISRAEMTVAEEEIMKAFDILCFTGNTHMKRGQGLKSFPIDLLYKISKYIDLVSYIGEMFKRRMKREIQIENRL